MVIWFIFDILLLYFSSKLTMKSLPWRCTSMLHLVSMRRTPFSSFCRYKNINSRTYKAWDIQLNVKRKMYIFIKTPCRWLCRSIGLFVLKTFGNPIIAKFSPAQCQLSFSFAGLRLALFPLNPSHPHPPPMIVFCESIRF